MDAGLARRLAAAGIDPARPGDPADAWRRLHERCGRRATVIDRYALEAASRGIAPEGLEREERARLAREVLAAQSPGLELVGPGGGDPIVVVEYRPSWPREFARWRERLRRTLGRTALRIEHVGSTAVPGLAAKPVIDVQVSVAEPEDEDAYAPAIEACGLPLRAREPGHRYFRPAPGRPRSVQVHVCAAGGDWEREHLLFRDYLRGNAALREEYGRLKRELATRYPDDRLAYTDAKTDFILDALERAEGWAARRDTSVYDPPRVS